MQHSNRPSTPSQKWGLFLLLTGALGFTLSMNPDHFNNIARNEGPLNVTDMAQTAAAPNPANRPPTVPVVRPGGTPTTPAASPVTTPAAPAATPAAAAPAATPAAATTPATTATPAAPAASTTTPGSQKINQIIGKDKKGNAVIFEAEAFTHSNTTYIKLNAVKGAPTDCADCLEAFKHPFATQASLTNIKELETVATALANGTSTTAAKVEFKPGQATEVDLAKWAEECETKKDTAKLTCHKKKLLALSKHLKNDEDQADLVKEYFMDHLHSKIRDGLVNPTLRETSAADCDAGKQAYMGSWGQIGCRDHDQLEDARTMAKDIIAGLRTANGKSVAKILIDLETKSYPAQMTSAQRLALEGKKEANIGKLNAGLMELNFFRNRGQFNEINNDLLSSIGSMQGTDAEQTALRTLLGSTFTTPVSKLLSGLDGFATNGRNILDARIQDFISTDGLLLADGRTRLAGQPGSTRVANGRSARRNGFASLFTCTGTGITSCTPTTTVHTAPSIFTRTGPGTPIGVPGLSATPGFNGVPGAGTTRISGGRTQR